MGDEYGLERRKKHIRENSALTDRTKKFLNNRFEKKVQQAGGKSEGTRERYLRQLENILETKELSIEEIQDLETKQLRKLNEEITDDIQESEFKKREGDLSKRNKRGYWTTWKRHLDAQGMSTAPHKEHMPNEVNRALKSRTQSKYKPT
jgi:hypothetical protein